MPIPSFVSADLAVVEPCLVLRGLEVFFDRPADSGDAHQFAKAGAGGTEANALFHESGLVGDQHAAFGVRRRFGHHVTHIVTQAVGVPGVEVQQPLHALRARLADRLRQGSSRSCARLPPPVPAGRPPSVAAAPPGKPRREPPREHAESRRPVRHHLQHDRRTGAQPTRRTIHNEVLLQHQEGRPDQRASPGNSKRAFSPKTIRRVPPFHRTSPGDSVPRNGITRAVVRALRVAESTRPPTRARSPWRPGCRPTPAPCSSSAPSPPG
jgi:hypothetical protein